MRAKHTLQESEEANQQRHESVCPSVPRSNLPLLFALCSIHRDETEENEPRKDLLAEEANDE